jgi:hypothetical protein
MGIFQKLRDLLDPPSQKNKPLETEAQRLGRESVYRDQPVNPYEQGTLEHKEWDDSRHDEEIEALWRKI